MFRLLHSVTFAALVVTGSTALAGDISSVKAPVEPSPLLDMGSDDEWEYTLGIPGWLVGIEGTAGVLGFTTPVDLDIGTILENLDGLALLQFEAQKGRVGFIFDGLYVKISDAPSTPGPLLSDINLGLQLGMVEGAVTYRIAQGERGYFDLLAGARYIYVGTDLGFNQDDAGIQQFSRNVSSAAIGAVSERLRDATAGAQQRVTDGLTNVIVDRVNERIEELLPPRFPPGRPTPQLGEAAEAYVNAAVAERTARAAGAVSARVRKRLERAQRQLERRIAQAVDNRLPNELSGSRDWVDPFIGFRGRYNLHEKVFLSGRGDIGGFGISSDETWQLFGGIGYDFGNGLVAEAGYRYLRVDYTRGGFTFDVEASGFLVGLSYTF